MPDLDLDKFRINVSVHSCSAILINIIEIRHAILGYFTRYLQHVF